MIADTFDQRQRYTGLSPRFAAAFKFLETFPAGEPDGRYDIAADDCFALVQSYTTRPVARARFEAHRIYADIQFIRAGRETILWSPLAALTQVTQPYVAEKDIAFYANPPHWTPIALDAGHFAIFFPEDGHSPGLEIHTPEDVRKIVIKIRI